MTRFRSPTSTPSSRADVDTMTQSRPSANACSARRRSSRDSEACTRCVVTPRARRSGAEHLDEALGVAEHQALVSPVQLRDDLGGVLHGPDVVKLNVLFRPVLVDPERAGGLPYRSPVPVPGRRPCPAAFPQLIPAASGAVRPGCRRWRTARSAAAADRRAGSAVQGRRADAIPGLRSRKRGPRPR